jgi:hypothetical protein
MPFSEGIPVVRLAHAGFWDPWPQQLHFFSWTGGHKARDCAIHS